MFVNNSINKLELLSHQICKMYEVLKRYVKKGRDASTKKQLEAEVLKGITQHSGMNGWFGFSLRIWPRR